MMGRLADDQGKFFYDFDLDDHVPADHLLRRIDAVLDLGWLRGALSPHYSHTGRPSVDPELMIRTLLVGDCPASVPSGGCAAKCISTWPIAGSAGSGWRTGCWTTVDGPVEPAPPVP